MKYKVTKKDLIGQIADFPIEVVQKMVERQIEYKNKYDISQFQYLKDSGFEWIGTPEGGIFWASVVYDKNFALFFEKYPKNKNIIIKNFKKKFNQFLNWISKLKNKRHGNNK